VLDMRRTFLKHREQLTAVAIVAHKPGSELTETTARPPFEFGSTAQN